MRLGLYIDGHEYEIIDKFCYLGDMLSKEGGCEHATLKRIQTGWLKFRELSGLLIGKGMSLRSKGIIYTTCIRPVMSCGGCHVGIETTWCGRVANPNSDDNV